MGTKDANISYADLPARWGVSCIQDGETLRIVLPPLPSVRYFSPWLLVGLAYVGAIVGVAGFQAFYNFRRGIRDVAGPANAAAMYGVILLILLGFAANRLLSKTIIELSPTWLSITRRIGRFTVSRRLWPRGRVGFVKFNPSSGKLFVQIVGETFLDVFVSPKREITEFVVQQLHDGLANLPTTGSIDSNIGARSDLPEPLPPGKARTALFILAALIAATGVIRIRLNSYALFGACSVARWARVRQTLRA